MNNFCLLDKAYWLLEQLEESIVERRAHKSNDMLFSESEVHLTETMLKAIYCDGISEGIKRAEGNKHE